MGLVSIDDKAYCFKVKMKSGECYLCFYECPSNITLSKICILTKLFLCNLTNKKESFLVYEKCKSYIIDFGEVSEIYGVERVNKYFHFGEMI